MALGAPELLILFVVGVLPILILVWSIIDIVRFDDHAWATAGQNKVLWIVFVVLFGCVGSLVYALIARPKLVATRG